MQRLPLLTTLPLSLCVAATTLAAPAAAQITDQTVLAEGLSGFPGPLDPGDLFGWSMASLGDLDGDGIDDMAVGSLLDDDGGPARGAVWILFLDSDGSVKSASKISSTSGGFTGDLDDADFFGTSLASLGDLDGDGVTDLAVGAYYDDDGMPDTGAVWILFLETDGTVKSHAKISSTEGGFTAPLVPLDWFGWAVCNLGDLDGDGVVDLAVAADGDDSAGLPGDDLGAFYVLFLMKDGSVKSWTKVTAGSGGFGGALFPSAYFASALANLGDVDGDGVVDLAVGADGDDATGTDAGALWICFMLPDGTVKAEARIDATTPGFPMPLMPGDQFGRSAASIGDFGGDPLPEVFVGADRTDVGGVDKGSVIVLTIAPDGGIAGGGVIGDMSGGFSGAIGGGDHFGNAVAVLGDLDGDGQSELAIGAEGSDLGGADQGAAWVCFFGPEEPEAYCFGVGCPCGNDDPFAGCGNSTGGGALLEASGSTSVALDDLTLEVIGATPASVGIVYMGGAAASTPFGDGLRCVGPGPFGLYRFGGQGTGAFGTLSETGVVASSGLIDAGETWYFQGWFRDVAGPCGTGFNLSNGVKVDFLP